MVRFLYRKVWDAERAEDLAQEVFVRALATGRTSHGLLAYNWPGNVRQLRNVIDSTVVMAEGEPDRGLPTWACSTAARVRSRR